MKILALGKRVVVQPDEKSDTDQFGFKLSEKSQVKVQKGIVVSTGEEVFTLEKGERVVYGMNSGVAVPDDEGNSYLAMNYAEIIAKL